MHQPTPQDILLKKERKIAVNHNNTVQYGIAIDAREKRINELKLLMELEDDAGKKQGRKVALITFLDSDQPNYITVDTSGIYL